MSESTRTEQEIINEAWLAQSACNLSGVVNSWSRALRDLWRLADGENKGTHWVNTHLACQLYADKVRQLTGDLDSVAALNNPKIKAAIKNEKNGLQLTR